MANAGDAASAPSTGAEAEVAEICRDLLRIDTSNYGDSSGPGERAAAEYVAAALAEVGLEPVVVESERNRTSVVARVAGEDPARPALLIHGHTDVVPAEASDWTYPPFAGEVADGCLWGRGAVDMKDMDAMTLAVIRDRLRSGRRPPRDVVLAFVADEEAGGTKGAAWLVERHPELFEGCTEAVGEVGGFSVTVGEQRLYAIETAEKGLAWLRLVVEGRAGHGSMLADDNAVAELCAALARLGEHRFPVRLTKTVRTFLDEIADVLGIEVDPDDPAALVALLGSAGRMIGATMRHTAQPTMLQAGYKVNVIPGQATAHVDARLLPGLEEEFFTTLREVLGPRVRIEPQTVLPAVETGFDGPLVEAMTSSLLAEDPGARVVPYCLSGATDAKSFTRLGIRCFGFAPLRLPPDLDFTGMFHGVDERVPLESLAFGTRVLDRFLDSV